MASIRQLDYSGLLYKVAASLPFASLGHYSGANANVNLRIGTRLVACFGETHNVKRSKTRNIPLHSLNFPNNEEGRGRGHGSWRGDPVFATRLFGIRSR